ncbi:hypothetical protein [Roseiconus lacunae]|uniref:hypothetical protein n=1 Tax=Roseiconus lacunae TaxID=2605694 RepID=UPI001E60EC00|nr:hypothetical protein [Roseiconus lacunae]MCD0463605.1 hypothetical protein [Roseiconus lacunae]
MPLLSRDAERFCEMVELLSEKEVFTYSGIANKLEISESTLRAAISRLSAELNTAVVDHDNSGSIATLAVTSAGRILYDRLLDCTRPIAADANSKPFSLVVSSAMVSSGLLDGMLDSLHRVGKSVPICLRTQVQFESILEGLDKGSIDLAILWGSDRRQRHTAGSEISEKIVAKLDIVIVSHDQAVIDLVNPAAHWFNPNEELNSEGQKAVVETALQKLNHFRGAFLSPDNQPANELIPRKARQDPGGHLEVDTIEGALALVRSRVADYAVVAAFYDKLGREQQLGTLVFSEPIASIPLIVMSRKAMHLTPFVDTVLEDLSIDLRRNNALAMWKHRKTATDRFPRSTEFYQKLRYGYYIGADARIPDAPLQWCWESIRLVFDQDQRSKSIRGYIVNEFRSKFEITSAEFRDTFFAARVKPIRRGKSRMKEFLTRFHYCDYKSGVICGTWTGTARGDRSGVFATVWSQTKLDLDELTLITRIADLYSVMSAQQGCENKEDQQELADELLTQLAAGYPLAEE